MAQPNFSSFLVTPKTVDQVTHSIVDSLGKTIPVRGATPLEARQTGGAYQRGVKPSDSNQVVFDVTMDASDAAVSAAVEQLFSVKVKAVNTLVRKGKIKRFRSQLGHRKSSHSEGISAVKRVSATVKTEVRNALQQQLRENVHAAVQHALEQANVHVVTTADLNLLEQVKRIQLQRSQDRIDTVFEILLDGYDPTTATIAKIDQQNAEERVRFLKDIETVTSSQLAEINGHTAKNSAQTANRWKSKNKIFGVLFQGQNLFPAFQFRDGQPRAVIADILSALPVGMTEWQTAFWFVSSNASLDGRAPYRCLDEWNNVIEAAGQEGLL